MAKSRKYYSLHNVQPEDYISKLHDHRYVLTFKTRKPHGGMSVAVIQMNPSWAGPTQKGGTQFKLDSTIGKVLCWCYDNSDCNFEIVHCLNLFSYVEPNPDHLMGLTEQHLNDLKNDEWIISICKEVDCIILAYGDCKGIDKEILATRIEQVLQWFVDKTVYHVGDLTRKKNPRHGRSWNNDPYLYVFKHTN